MKLETLLKTAKLSREEKADATAWFDRIRCVDCYNVINLISDFSKHSRSEFKAEWTLKHQEVADIIGPTAYADLVRLIKRHKLDSRIPNFGVYAVGSTVTGAALSYNDIDLVWADPRFALSADFAGYVKTPAFSKTFKTTYITHDIAEAFIRTEGTAPVHVGIPRCYETVLWFNAVINYGKFLTPRQYEATKEFKDAKAVVLYRSK
jgi:hypothetical protein